MEVLGPLPKGFRIVKHHPIQPFKIRQDSVPVGFDDGTAHFIQEASNSLKPLEISKDNVYKTKNICLALNLQPYLRDSIVLLRIQILLILLKFKC